MSHGVEANWTAEDRFHIANLTVPVPSNEQKRIEVLRKSKLLDITTNDTGFGRFTSLASRLFNMAYSVVSFVEVDRVVFKAKLGIDFTDIGRNDWFDAYTVLPDVSEVYVVPDCLTDARFKDKAYVKGYPKIRFYAGAAIMVDNLKIGVLSIMDTEPHKFFSLEDKENLLDLGAAAAQLAKEKLQTALNLSAERANIVVSMMHHLRTPMTSLNFATSLLCNDVHSIRTDYNGPGALPTGPVGHQQPESMMEVDTVEAAHEETKETSSLQPPQSVFQSFESSFTEISNALNQLNILVDSSLSLGQAIIKCSSNEVAASSSSNNLQAMDPRSRFTECNIIDYLHDMFQNNLPVHNHNLEIEWIVDTNDLVRGTHVTFPDAVMLIVISTVSHMSTESNSLGFHFSFETVEEDDMEYPELISKMLEGRLAIKVFAKDSRPFPGRLENVSMDTMSTDDNDHVASASQPVNSNNNNNNNNNSNGHSPDVLSKQNFLSIDKILRAINGSSREFVDDILLFSTVQHDPSGAGGLTKSNGPRSDIGVSEYRTIHEFLVPCKILLNSFADGGRSPNQRQKQLRYFRPSMKYMGTNTVSQQSTPNFHSRGGPSIPSQSANADARATETEQQQQQQQQQQNSITQGTGIILPAPIVTGVAPIVDTVAMGNASPGAGTGAEAATSVDAGKPRPLRVLVVEDTIPVQKLLTRWLQNQGCSVTCASNGKIGLDYLTSQAFDIAFVDFLMPVMLGITTMKLFQQWVIEHPPERSSLVDENRSVLIVGMSATALESEQEEAFNYGMHFFCPKPVSLELLTIILDAKRSNAANLDDAIDQICDITGTAATDVAMSAGEEGEEEGRSPRAGALTVDAASAEAGGEGGNPKNKWTFFRSFRQSRLHSGQGEEDDDEANEEPQSSVDK